MNVQITLKEKREEVLEKVLKQLNQVIAFKQA